MPPKIRIINTIAIIAAIMRGTISLKNARATIAIAAITRRVKVDPRYGRISSITI